MASAPAEGLFTRPERSDKSLCLILFGGLPCGPTRVSSTAQVQRSVVFFPARMRECNQSKNWVPAQRRRSIEEDSRRNNLVSHDQIIFTSCCLTDQVNNLTTPESDKHQITKNSLVIREVLEFDFNPSQSKWTLNGPVLYI